MKQGILLFLVFLLSCTGNHFKESKEFVGGVKVSASTLNLGHTTYLEYCVSCHGDKGDGKGVASKGMNPAPRNFTLGLYKFGRVASGELPHDEDFAHIIKNGLKGTAMLPWDISEERLYAVIQYIKTFAPGTWEKKEATLGTPIVPTKDPYGLAHQTVAIEKGREVFHVTAQCTTCHRGYIPAPPTADNSWYQLKIQGSEYGTKILPPDFTWHFVRSASTVEELYVRIASGVGGTPMPGWRGVLEDHEIWAVAYYVKSLMDLKDKPEREAFMAGIKK